MSKDITDVPAFIAYLKSLSEGWIGSITANYVSNITWILIGLILAGIYRFVSDRNSLERRILKAKKRYSCLLTYGLILEATGAHNYTALEEGDGNALARTYSKIARFFPSTSITTINSNENEGILGKSDFVVSLSGPVWNKTTEYLIGRSGSPVWLEKGKGLVCRDHNGETVYQTEYGEANTPTTCYGMILCSTRVIHNKSRQRLLVLCGLSNLSTFGASLLLENLGPQIKSKYGIFKRFTLFKKQFCIIFKVQGRYLKSRSKDSYYLSEDQCEVEILNVIRDADFLESRDYLY